MRGLTRIAAIGTGLMLWLGLARTAVDAEPLVIAASPSVKAPVQALARRFEAIHPEITVLVSVDTGLGTRQTVSAVENDPLGRYILTGRGPIHVVAPGGDELIERLQTRYYLLPGTARAYAAERLVLVVPVELVDAPTSFEEMRTSVKRLAVADPDRTMLGQQTRVLLESLGYSGQLDVSTDARGVLSHLLSGQAEAGIVFGHEAAAESERVRVVAVATTGYTPTVHSMAMVRSCPNRPLCEAFLAFIQSAEAQTIVRGLGYAVPAGR